jgi:hypothetical protein
MTRSEKNAALAEACINRMCDEDKAIYRPILEYALELGYTPKPVKKADGDDGELAFAKSKYGRTLLRILPSAQKEFENYPLYKLGRAQLRLVFFAEREYSAPFKRGIQQVIEAFGGKYTGCYGCGRCGGKPQGYIFTYPEGKKVFRCGRELIALPPLTVGETEEVLRMMKAQDEFWGQTAV